MVKLLVGSKGAGKTKQMIALANERVDTKKGELVFINKNDRLNFDLKHDIRLISMVDFPQIDNSDEYVGFLYGLASGNSDIEVVYIDGILKHSGIELDEIHLLLDRLKEFAEKMEIEIFISLSAEREELGKVELDKFTVLN